eukprot:TRINITY_DN3465_c0_g3_i3.p1 TRINITY_DN3465_c0_g3~~TRINITY_DN3465_c0_g3_i3.p1  ORF type:complete len:696 (-),score=157.49 TRINITY_DN3465_c0_g3_i3:338-2425(-)
MNHLDVGFDGIPGIGYSFNVINRYFDVYFPLSFNTSKWLNDHPNQFGDKYVYTTHPYLVWWYLNCPTPSAWQYPSPGLAPNTPGPELIHCPNETMVQLMIDNIKKGNIAWHAFPFNAEAEMMDATLFESALTMAQDLNKIFGFPNTLTMSQRDVPGTTRAIIPLLNKMGVKALTVGVNGGSAPPAVPSAFVWKDLGSNTQILAMWHPGGYGGIEISDCVIVDGLTHALAFAFRGDNAGPHTVDEVEQVLDQLRSEFPGAKVIASTYDAFVTELSKVQHTLPVITSEIGDTWIHGCASDPNKVAQYRAILRARAGCIHSGRCNIRDPEFKAFDHFLIKIAEHTWGVDIKEYPDDWSNWSNDQFEKARSGTNYKIAENSWLEQRSFLLNALSELSKSKKYEFLVNEIKYEWAKIALHNAPDPTAQHFVEIPQNEWTKDFTLDNGWTIQFDKITGGLQKLNVVKKNGEKANWASGDQLLGEYIYHTYDNNDYQNFFANYSYDPTSPWVQKDFGKFNVSEANPQHLEFKGELKSLWHKSLSTKEDIFLLNVNLPEHTVSFYGAPKQIWLQIEFHEDILHYTVMLIDKTPTRLPESHWFSFNPALDKQDEGHWRISKLSSWIDPLDIQKNGSFHLHGFDDNGVWLNSKKGEFKVRSLDATVVCVGDPTPFPTPMDLPDITKGMNFNLFNNIWDTKYVDFS